MDLILSTRDELLTLIEESLKKVLSETIANREENNRFPELLTVKQASQYLNLATQTLYGFTSNRTIPFIKKGKKLVFEKSSLDKWLLAGRKQMYEEIGATPLIKKGKGGKHG